MTCSLLTYDFNLLTIYTSRLNQPKLLKHLMK